MSKTLVSIVKYGKPLESVRKAVELAKGLENLPLKAKVFIKPNIVYWNRHSDFPKWGVITTTRVIEDVIILLKEKGIDDITIGEGIISEDAKDRETALDAFEKLGFNTLNELYGVKAIDTFDRPFETIELSPKMSIKMNSDMLNSDFLVDIPVLKTHAQCMVSLGIKNLKGLLNIASRKKMHSADPELDLDYNVAQLSKQIPRSLTLIDGIYSIERGPAFDGKARRSDIIVASTDILSADLVGSKLLGIDPSTVPHLIQAAKDRNRPTDLSDIEVVGEKIEDLASPHEWDYIYENNNTLPLPYAKAGITGIKYHKYDTSLCTYCSFYTGFMLMAIKWAWKGKPFDKVEVLLGKKEEPTEGMNKTILVGQCQCNKNKDNPKIKECIPIMGCPPTKEDIRDALKKAGIKVNPVFFKNLEKATVWLKEKYKDKPEFVEDFYQIKN
jgi:uncharacterized protein (DUF362 family)